MSSPPTPSRCPSHRPLTSHRCQANSSIELAQRKPANTTTNQCPIPLNHSRHDLKTAHTIPATSPASENSSAELMDRTSNVVWASTHSHISLDHHRQDFTSELTIFFDTDFLPLDDASLIIFFVSILVIMPTTLRLPFLSLDLHLQSGNPSGG